MLAMPAVFLVGVCVCCESPNTRKLLVWPSGHSLDSIIRTEAQVDHLRRYYRNESHLLSAWAHGLYS